MNSMLERLEDNGAEVEEVLDRLMGDEEMYIEYINQFPDNENIVLLKKAVEEKNYKEAERQVHTLKGIALNLGLLPVVDVCMDMLMEYRGGNPEQAGEFLEEIEDTFKEWCGYIKDEG